MGQRVDGRVQEIPLSAQRARYIKEHDNFRLGARERRAWAPLLFQVIDILSGQEELGYFKTSRLKISCFYN